VAHRHRWIGGPVAHRHRCIHSLNKRANFFIDDTGIYKLHIYKDMP
jgi:hypothetical protein